MGGNHVTIIPSKVIIILITDFSTHVTQKEKVQKTSTFHTTLLLL
jgi:hypothetical protein